MLVCETSEGPGPSVVTTGDNTRISGGSVSQNLGNMLLTSLLTYGRLVEDDPVQGTSFLYKTLCRKVIRSGYPSFT